LQKKSNKQLIAFQAILIFQNIDELFDFLKNLSKKSMFLLPIFFAILFSHCLSYYFFVLPFFFHIAIAKELCIKVLQLAILMTNEAKLFFNVLK
jgi:hypothetical protein